MQWLQYWENSQNTIFPSLVKYFMINIFQVIQYGGFFSINLGVYVYNTSKCSNIKDL